MTAGVDNYPLSGKDEFIKIIVNDFLATGVAYFASNTRTLMVAVTVPILRRP